MPKDASQTPQSRTGRRSLPLPLASTPLAGSGGREVPSQATLEYRRHRRAQRAIKEAQAEATSPGAVEGHTAASQAASASCSVDQRGPDIRAAIGLRVSILEVGFQELEELVARFKGSVENIAKEFEDLSNDIDNLSNECEAAEIDYLTAAHAVEEEKATVAHWERKYMDSLTQKKLERTYALSRIDAAV
ncbi:hypothetical protein DFP72DRAFT_1077081 [Ephemerocybe angulata]|uniref:Uncharacterized protein n=1 Tax=Ephemerocybe angulata TaxID=980116 RepID=A0A8H6HH70_9AGAR|nr:hypothetical protein DFP72DRAFT_1077081 [Tulosesus angulatus]